MRRRIVGPAAGALLLNALVLCTAHAQSAAVHRQGRAVFKRSCAVCHKSLLNTGGMPQPGPNGHAVPIPTELLRHYAPEQILTALTSGKMQAQGAALTVPERRAVAQFLAGRPFGAVLEGPQLGRRCTDPAPMADPASTPSWNGWGNGPENLRYQSKRGGGLTAADLPHLKLKWAFGYANVPSARTQPAIVGGRLFAASENGAVYALDPKSGCTYWMFKALAGVPTALSVAPYTRAAGSGYAVLFGDRQANAYAVDAQTGRQIWRIKVDTNPAAALTGAPTVYEGRVFVPVQGVGEEGAGIHAPHGCCTFRGSVAALDLDSGKLLWKTYMVPEEPKPRGKTREGLPIFGPSGVGIWSAPTVDAKRGLIYVATGNAYSGPPQRMSDAVVALDIATGTVRWVSQVLADDVWAMGCAAKNAAGSGCPATLGPDYDLSASPALAHLQDGRDLLVLPQKSGMSWALDPDHEGRIVWKYRIGKGSGLGGEWGAAVEDGRVFFGTADLLTTTAGGIHALNLADGSLAWAAPRPMHPLCAGLLSCSTGQGAALTAIPGAVLSGVMDGGVRAYSTRTGKVIWVFNTNRSFKTVNGVKASGGSMDGSSPVAAGGMLFVNSGNGGLVGQPGNVLLAFGLD